MFGGYRERVTPVPISNTEVKPLIADGTAWNPVWESRTLPDLQLFNSQKARLETVGLFVFVRVIDLLKYFFAGFSYAKETFKY